MYVHESARLVFLANPRTASRSVAAALQGVGFRGMGDRVLGNWTALHHMTLAEAAHYGIDLSGYDSFSVARNHWDAIASWMYARGVEESPPWSAAAIDRLVSARGRYFLRVRVPVRADEGPTDVEEYRMYSRHPGTVLSYENLEPELNELLESRGLPGVTLPWFGKSESRRAPLSALYQPEAVRRVEELFMSEIYRFGYKYEGAG